MRSAQAALPRGGALAPRRRPHLWCFRCSAGLKVNTSDTGTAMNSLPLPCKGGSAREVALQGGRHTLPLFAPSTGSGMPSRQGGRQGLCTATTGSMPMSKLAGSHQITAMRPWRSQNSQPTAGRGTGGCWHLHEQEVAGSSVAQAALGLAHKPRPPRLPLQHPLPGQPARSEAWAEGGRARWLAQKATVAQKNQAGNHKGMLSAHAGVCQAASRLR